MSTPVAPGIVAFQAIWIQENEQVENTFNYKMTGAITTATLQAIHTAYSTWLGTHTALFSNACALVKLQSRDLSSTGGVVLEQNITPAISGTDTGAAQPNNVTWALKRQTGLRGRANRGRIYVIGLASDRIASGAQQMNAADANSFVTSYNALLTQMSSAAGAQEVILHRALGTSTPVIGYVYSDLTLDSQRRRLPGHNRHR